MRKYSGRIEDLIKRYEANKDYRYKGIVTGEIYKGRGVRVTLDWERKKGQNVESFPVSLHQSVRRPNSSYLRAYVAPNSRLAGLVGNTLPYETVLLHHLLFAIAGRKVPKDYEIHHCNVNHLDSRYQNLVMTPRWIHQLFHELRDYQYEVGRPQEIAQTKTTLKDLMYKEEITLTLFLHVYYGVKGEEQNDRVLLVESPVVLPPVKPREKGRMRAILDAILSLGRERKQN